MRGSGVLAKIAVDLERAVARRKATGAPGGPDARILAAGPGWVVEDVICTSGPTDRAFEERHAQVSVAIVTAGTFQYRSPAGRELMTPGSLLLGAVGQCFECGHEHGTGDRCVAFRFDPAYFERITAGVGGRVSSTDFRIAKVPPLRETAALVAAACLGVAGGPEVSWEELGVELAGRAAEIAGGLTPGRTEAPPSAVARVTRSVRAIERDAATELGLEDLARAAGLSPFHFLRVFQQITGVTPHQYLRRVRLREAATRLRAEPGSISAIALSCGFGDLSAFNRAFRTEFGLTPTAYRRPGRR